MALDPRYIPLYHLQQDFLNKQTGLQLAGGVMYTWHDNNRNSPKPLFELSGAPPNYTYTQLPNPITLSNAGTVTDGGGNDITVYAFPYDQFGNPDNYYIQVFAAPTVPPFPPVGTPILTREAVPGIVTPTGPQAEGPRSISNMISNSQFAQVNFNPDVGMTIVYGAGETITEIAPGWFLKLTGSGAGTVDVTRNSVAGISKFATNPPYSLTLDPNGGVNLTQMMLYQRLDHNPDIFATTNPPGEGFINGGIALANGSGTVSMYWAPMGTAFVQPVFQFANGTTLWRYDSDTIDLPPGSNPNNSDSVNGFVDIQLIFPTTSVTTFSSVQVVQVGDDDITSVPYNQVPVNQQVQTTSFYYNPRFAYKNVPSYLVGWDFPKNPAQPLGDGLAATTFATGANTGFYAWDQTIIFQTVTSSVGFSRATNGGLELTCQAPGQVALIQYLDQVEARKILSDRASVNISASTTHAGGLSGTVSLWACTSVGLNLPTLPTTGISALSATAVPTMGNGTWTEVPNLFQNKRFTLEAASATNEESADIMLNGWDMEGAAPTDTALFFAIVVAFEPWIAADTITVNSISLCPGDIATRPAPKTTSETIFDCQKYYWKTFIPGLAPAQAAGVNTGEFYFLVQQADAAQSVAPTIIYPTPLRTIPTILLYNPLAANNQVRNFVTTTDSTSTAIGASSRNILSVTCIGRVGWALFQYLIVHITADARLGVVN